MKAGYEHMNALQLQDVLKDHKITTEDYLKALADVLAPSEYTRLT